MPRAGSVSCEERLARIERRTLLVCVVSIGGSNCSAGGGGDQCGQWVSLKRSNALASASGLHYEMELCLWPLHQNAFWFA